MLSVTGVCFPIELFHHFKYDSGSEPVQVWVLISGFSQFLWKDFELQRVAKEFGGILLDVDPRCARHIDFTELWIKIAVPRK
jgi:hypothetical protein